MTDGEGKLTKGYRELAREEPPRALDVAILAASRRAVAKPSLSRRWGVPVSIAAVLVLAFGLTLEMRHERPDVSTSPPASMPIALPPSAAPAEAPEAEEAPAQKLEGAAKPQPLPQKKALPLREERAPLEQPPATPPPARNAPQPAAAVAPRADYNIAPAAAGAAPASAARMKSSADSAERASSIEANPAQELERIAKLRADGDDAEADRLLAEFQRRYPSYAIPRATWERVKPR